jgi:hypothetical protein
LPILNLASDLPFLGTELALAGRIIRLITTNLLRRAEISHTVDQAGRLSDNFVMKVLLSGTAFALLTSPSRRDTRSGWRALPKLDE